MIGELSGKMGGIVFSRNKAGAYMRQYVVPTDPATLAQLNSRALFGSSASNWHNLTNAEKMAWSSFSTNVFNPKNPSPGVAYSGFNAFVSLQNTILNANNKILDPVLAGDFVISSDGGAYAYGDSELYSMGTMPPQTTNPDGRFGDGLGGVFDLSINSVALASSSMNITVTSFATMGTTNAPFVDPVGSPVNWPASMIDGLGQKVGLAVYVSNAVSQAQDFITNPYLICAGYLAHPKVGAGVGSNGYEWTMIFKSKVLKTAQYQAVPAPGEIRRISLFQVSRDGRHKLIGARTCTVS